MPKFTWKPARSIQECNSILTGPGQFHEMEHAIIDGAVYRVYKNCWPSVREYWLSVVSNNLDIHSRDYIVFEDFRLSYAQADELVQRAASVFREVYGVRKGDRIGIAMRNYPEWIISFFAAGLLGAVPTLFNAWLPIEPFLHCVKLTTPKLMVVDSERLKLLDPRLISLHIPSIVVRPSSDLGTVPELKEWSKVLSSYSGPIKAWEKEPEALPDENATIFFTSGTTGYPKGVLSSQRGFLGNFFDVTYAGRRRELRLGNDLPPPLGAGPPPDEEVPFATLVTLPLFHVTACTSQLISGTATGGKVVLMRKWNKEEAAELIMNEKIISIIGVPSIAYDLMETKLVGNTVVEAIATGGAPAADSLAGEVVQKFPNARLIQQGYGLSETNSVAASVVGEDFLERPGSTGLPPATVDLLIVDPNTNKVLPHGNIGELWIRGPNLMRGYVNNPEATTAAISRDGWLKSGDLAVIDEEGFLYIKDRVKDMIIRGGENIHSIVIENALFADERILDCAAVGIPDKRLGELVAAVVVPRKDWIGKLSEKSILQKVESHLPKFAIPSIILVQNDALERNAAGKTLKAGLRKKVTLEWERRNKPKGKL